MPNYRGTLKGIGTCFVLVLVAVAGCAVRPPENEAYASLLVGHQSVSVSEALAAGPIDQVQPGQDYEFQLSDQSPVLEENGVRAGYRVIAFTLSTSKPLDIDTRSFCDCLGLKKYVALPILRLFDASGGEIRVAHGFPKWRDPDGHHSASITRHWTSVPMPAGVYRLLMYADNVEPGTVLVVRSEPDTMWAIRYALTTYPFGKAWLRIQ